MIIRKHCCLQYIYFIYIILNHRNESFEHLVEPRDRLQQPCDHWTAGSPDGLQSTLRLMINLEYLETDRNKMFHLREYTCLAPRIRVLVRARPKNGFQNGSLVIWFRLYFQFEKVL